MSKIVCTAFVPFGNRKENMSQIVLNELEMKDSVDLEKNYLDVSWINTPKQIIKIFENNNDLEALILCGEAGLYKKVCLEYVAINLMNAYVGDNQGIYKENERIDDSLPDAFFSTCDCFKMTKDIKSLGYDVMTSLSAGSYICNLSYFTALKIVKEQKLNTKVIFVHFPTDYKKEYKEILQKIVEKILE